MAVADNIGILTVQPPTVGICPRKPPGLDCVNARLLAAATAENIAVPGAGANAANYVRLAATADIYVNFSGAAAVPGDVTDGTASELIPAGKPEWYYVKGVTNISVISAVTPIVTASFYV